jgi:sulfite reductase (NADPH) flavoprotein alpha-component
MTPKPTQVAPFIPENAPFTAEQRLWLNGYMAGLLAGRNMGPVQGQSVEGSTTTIPLVILFGSQTGTAEKLAKQFAKQSKSSGCNSRVVDCSAHATVDWAEESNLLIVTSTYGDGDMPDNAQSFWQWLQTENGKSLAHLNFAVLALGDSNYEKFCAAGKNFDQRLEALGAKRAYPCVECDVDYETKAKEWINGVLSAMAPGKQSDASPADDDSLAADGWSKTNPFPARLITNRRLNGAGSQKETRHFEISLEGSGLAYEAGDALGVWPRNCPDLVSELIAAGHFKGDESVTVSGTSLPLRQALTEKLDIGKPGLELLHHFAKTNATLQPLLAPERKDDLKKWLWGRGVIDLLAENAVNGPSAGEFVALLKPLQPRLYSISSSPKAHAGQVHLTINVVRYESFGRARQGLASTFLADRVDAETPVPIFIQTSHGFRLPANGKTPVIMVGPGTGIAPFRAFLHERRASAATGPNWLFFGEQRAATDFYYREELEQLFSDGHLTKLCTAFSRDQAEKIYVQNRMLENAAALWSWLEDGAHFYVCGDASRMARDVDEALHQIAQTAGGKSADEAAAYVAKMKLDKRYQRDVY